MNLPIRSLPRIFLLAALAAGGALATRAIGVSDENHILRRGSTVDKSSVIENYGKTEFAFSPGNESTELVAKVIRSATKTIRLAGYSFTSKPLAEALVAAHRGGVDVQVVLDKSNATAKYSSATFLANAGVPTRIDSKHPIAHSKYMIIDDKTVETGSFNYTKAAKSNSENVIVFWDSSEIAKTYSANWKLHWDHSSAYSRSAIEAQPH